MTVSSHCQGTRWRATTLALPRTCQLPRKCKRGERSGLGARVSATRSHLGRKSGRGLALTVRNNTRWASSQRCVASGQALRQSQRLARTRSARSQKLAPRDPPLVLDSTTWRRRPTSPQAKAKAAPPGRPSWLRRALAQARDCSATLTSRSAPSSPRACQRTRCPAAGRRAQPSRRLSNRRSRRALAPARTRRRQTRLESGTLGKGGSCCCGLTLAQARRSTRRQSGFATATTSLSLPTRVPVATTLRGGAVSSRRNAARRTRLSPSDFCPAPSAGTLGRGVTFTATRSLHILPMAAPDRLVCRRTRSLPSSGPADGERAFSGSVVFDSGGARALSRSSTGATWKHRFADAPWDLRVT